MLSINAFFMVSPHVAGTDFYAFTVRVGNNINALTARNDYSTTWLRNEWMRCLMFLRRCSL